MTMFKVRRETDKNVHFECEAPTPQHAALAWAKAEWNPFPSGESAYGAVVVTVVVATEAGSEVPVCVTASPDVTFTVRHGGSELTGDELKVIG